jgi:hypothetical protein
MRCTSAPVHARTRFTIAWERSLPPPTSAAPSQLSPIAATEPVTDPSATPLTTTNPSTWHGVAVAERAARDALVHPTSEQED